VFRSVFPLEPAVAHQCFLKYFQRGDDGVSETREALVAEVWGALVLVALADVAAKVDTTPKKRSTNARARIRYVTRYSFFKLSSF
jgi:hypothetical protein